MVPQVLKDSRVFQAPQDLKDPRVSRVFRVNVVFVVLLAREAVAPLHLFRTCNLTRSSQGQELMLQKL